MIGLQTVGVVLMSAMLVAPAAAARQWTDRLGVMAILAAGVGALAGATGAVASSQVERLPTGPTIVLVSTALVVVSLLFAPRGLALGLAGATAHAPARGRTSCSPTSRRSSRHTAAPVAPIRPPRSR